MAEPTGGGFDDFDARLRALKADTGLQQQDEPAARASVSGSGVQVGVELVVGVAAGGLMGYGLDTLFGTWPALFLVFFLLGSLAGMLNAYRHIRKVSSVR